jgi:hypothetical protein
MLCAAGTSSGRPLAKSPSVEILPLRRFFAKSSYEETIQVCAKKSEFARPRFQQTHI